MKLIIGVLMTNSMKKPILFFILIALFFISCKNNNESEKAIDASVPVTLTSIDTNSVESYIDLNATAAYLVKNVIKANATGYLNSVNVASSDYVSNGAVLFSIKTREAKVLGNTINIIDPSLNFGGAIKVRANTNGFVTSVNVQQGDYVQDGDALVTINDTNSFAIVLSLPYEFKKYVSISEELTVILPDSTLVKAKVQNYMPTVDATSQTQSVILKVIGKHDIPENLIVKVRINKSSNSKTVSLPKAAVLSNETETDFWIMKMINNNTAIKIPIKKGVETQDKVEILSPILTPEDKILLSGNYGVADTIKVKVIKAD
ncbi:HlyD family efflux transporter periplasmic adaptor subunit [Flavobacterium sp. GSP6]|uniref:HlyD family efflux transporter periplasmic adaptor subunit n=1 Tax=Flavobacterium sp. GSP6 TaxID=2497488 RepID=UPI000F87EDDF|nr:HlyD family efflux transporter periplasmic adaptor subunit [Flavobacterium sp. GSP6]RTZ03105.1 HlyD family efflux transporter periplasmic adaptor subunit [Flavobacterium sp. GSP6]